MLCGHWAATVCPAGFPAGTFNSFSKYACIVTVQIQTYCTVTDKVNGGLSFHSKTWSSSKGIN